MVRHVILVAGLLFGSGMCALIYQMVWLREFRFVFGASTLASAAVLSVFLGGLGAGGFWFGRRVDRNPRPLALYAYLELFIAASAALTPLLVWIARELYVALGGVLALGPVVATLVRLVLTACVHWPFRPFSWGERCPLRPELSGAMRMLGDAGSPCCTESIRSAL